MKIAYYSHYFAPEIGAPSARVYDLAQQWMASGNQVQVVTCLPNHPAGQLYAGYTRHLYMRENLDGIDVHRHWTYITPNKGFLKKSIGHVSYLPSALFLSNRRLDAPDITIGTSPTFFAAMAASSMAKQSGVPFIMEVRDLWPAIFVELGVIRNPRLIRWLERWEMALYRRATKVVTVTESFRRNLIERGVPDEKVVTVPNGADEEFWRPMERPRDLAQALGLNDSFVVLYIGAHGISHALSRVLDAAQELRSHPHIRFVFVGDGAEKPRLVEQARQQGLANVQFLDAVDRNEVRQFYALADVCLVPLRDVPLFETFIPSKMFEIMAMSRPIVASVSGETADILQQSSAAIVVRPEDSRAIAESILHLYRNRNEARAMGEAGRDFVVRNYSRRSLAAAYLEIMEEAIAEHRRMQR